MFETLKNAWKIDSLRKKILFTLMVILIYRVGTDMIIPFINPIALAEVLSGAKENVFDTINAITGSSLGQTTLFALGVQPYINASIIMQLLSVAIPALENLAKEGESGRKKINTITKWVTMGLSLAQAIAMYAFMHSSGLILERTGFSGVIVAVAIVAITIAGANLCVWLGNQVNEHGIGNGISMIIFAGVLSRFPAMVKDLYNYFLMGLNGDTKFLILAPIMLIIYIAMIVAIIYVTNAERQIRIQYAKRVVGRKMMGGNTSYIPIKVNMAGVMPVIFASTFLSIPGLIIGFSPNINTAGGWYKFLNFFDSNSLQYGIIYFVLVFAFTFFNSSIQFDSVKMSNDLRMNGGTIPGIRQGKPTSDYIDRVVRRINVIGGLFLAVVAAFPIFFGVATGMRFSLAGTSIIIVVGVCLETVKQMESEMMMRHYKGFLQ